MMPAWLISQDKGNDSANSDEPSHITPDDGHIDEGVEEEAAAIASVAPQANLIDPTVQYQFRTENGQGGAVTYRVVQVSQPEVAAEAPPGSQVVTTAAALVGQQVTQTIITNPFTTTNGNGSPSGEGQFYVMMSPQDMLQTGPRTLAPRSHQYSQKSEGPKTARDERRRATHNEVERRRRDKINNWIIKLSKIVPDCASEHAKQGQVALMSASSSCHQPLQLATQEQRHSDIVKSKGGILAKACDYINELRNANARLPEILKENERLIMDIDLLRQQCEELKNENQVLRAHLQQHGITVGDLGGNS